MKNFCGKCGSPLDPSGKCPNCGRKFKSTTRPIQDSMKHTRAQKQDSLRKPSREQQTSSGYQQDSMRSRNAVIPPKPVSRMPSASPGRKTAAVLGLLIIILGAIALGLVFLLMGKGEKRADSSRPTDWEETILEETETHFHEEEEEIFTESPVESPTEKPTEPPAEPPTEKPTEPPAEPPTEKPTEPPTEPPTEKLTESPTEPPTEKPTEPPTETPTEKTTEPPVVLNAGDIVWMGSYPTEEDAIEWVVLTVQDDYALLLSRFALECRPYHYEKKEITYEDSSIRSWLNDTFYPSAFTEKEKECIQRFTVSAAENPYYDIDPGNQTKDHVFLLSCAEAETYLNSDTKRLCNATPHAVSQGIFLHPATGCCWWWLRTPGYSAEDACSVNSDGSMDYDDGTVNSIKAGVRPAVWVRYR